MNRTALATAPGAATTYDGFYLRNNLDCTGTVPSSGPYDLCPDIIQSSVPIDDPQTVFSTPASWNTAYNTQPALGEKNYYYVRGLNGATDTVHAAISLYYAPAQLVLFPPTWQHNQLSTTGGLPSVSVSAASGAIGVGGKPFVWVPALPSGSDFYALIAQAVDRGSTNPIPTITSWLDMATLLTQDLGFGYNNTCYVESSAATWYHRLGLSIPASLPTAGQVLISVSSSGFSGGAVGLIGDLFTSDQQAILLQPVTLGPGQFQAITVTLDPGFSTILTVEYWAGTGVPPAPGSVITVTAYYLIPPEEATTAVLAGLVDGVQNHFVHQQVGIGPTPMAILGSANFVVNHS